MNEHTKETIARVGIATKGAIYLGIGVLAAMWAFGEGGQVTGGKGIIARVAQLPGGTVLLALLGAGLAAYALFRALQAISPPRAESGTKAVAKRVGRAASALIHGFLAFSCLQALALGGTAGSSEQGQKTYLGKLIAMDGGQWIVIAIGVCVIGAALFQVYKVVSHQVEKRLDLSALSSAARTWIIRMGKLGLSARAVVFAIIGYFLIRAGLSADASQAKTTGGALREISGQSYGLALLAIVAIGLAAYGAYMVASARFRTIET